MQNNPIDTNSFRHFLIIRGVDYEISEPINFNQSNFKITQDDIARDTFLGNEESPLQFEISFGNPTSSFVNNDGVTINHLPSGAELLIQENLDYGNESDVKYKLTKNNISFTTGNIDFSTDFNTDNETYVHCRVIQNNKQSLIKKREDVTIDALSDKDLDDNTIVPITVQKMFFRAKPVYKVSEWDNGVLDLTPFSLNHFIFPSINLKSYNVENSFVPLDRIYTYGGGSGEVELTNSRCLKAKEDLSEVKVELRLNAIFEKLTSSGEDQSGGNLQIILCKGDETSLNLSPTPFYNQQISNVNNSSGTQTINTSFNIDVGLLSSGTSLVVVYYFIRGLSDTSQYRLRFLESNMTIEAKSTAISSTTGAVRLIDLIKQVYKGIGSLPVNAQKYDVGGEFYDNFCFNKNLIKQDLTKPFYVRLKDVKEHLLEQCSYAQVNDNEIHIGNFEDFYTNNYIGGFIEIPEYDSVFYKNQKYLVNKFVFGYEKYEQDRTEKNTVDAIHTDSEWFVQANNSINNKSIKLPFVRDAFLNEYMRKDAFSTNENSNESDTIGIVDVVPLPPNTRGGFTRYLSWQVDETIGTQKFLSDNTFSWDLLGFNVGDTIIDNGVNRVVLSITPTILTTTHYYGSNSYSGAGYITFDYPLTNVVYTNRTSEGLIYNENLRNADNFSNLKYSIKRNLKHWYSFLATYGKFIPTKKVKNTYFKSNGECITQFTGELAQIKENADINISDISNYKILSQDIYKTSVKCEFEQAVQLLKDIQDIRGFVIVQSTTGATVKGYIKEGNFVWADGILELELEVKNESDFLTITYSSGLLTINEVGYDKRTADIKLYNIFNDYIQFFDKNNVNLCNRTKFDKVLLNGISYTSVTDLVNAIELL